MPERHPEEEGDASRLGGQAPHGEGGVSGHARLAVAFGLLCVLASGTRAGTRDVQAPQDLGAQDFVVQAAHASQAEVALGKLAFEKSSSSAVKAFAQRTVQDHAKANQELAALARAQGWVMPAGPPKKHQAEEERLGRMSGEKFDGAYMQHAVKEHERVVRLFEQGSRQLRTPQLREWTTRLLPMLREHLDRARAILQALDRTAGDHRAVP